MSGWVRIHRAIKRARRATDQNYLADPADRQSIFTQRFQRDENGIIKDTHTGLEWLPGPDRNTSWEDAKAWVERLVWADGGWRFPAIEELRGLFWKERSSLNLDPTFQTTGWRVWSGDLHQSGLPFYFHFITGNKASYKKLNLGGERAFAVR